MTKPIITKTAIAELKEYLTKIGLDEDADFLREGVQLLSQMLMEAEVEKQVGAGKHERTPRRSNYRNGYRERTWQTRVGEIELAIPKLRKGSYFPSLLEPRRPAEKALLAVVQEAYIKGVSTRKVDALLKALGLTGIDKSRVSRICKELDQAAEQFRQRPLQESYPYVWLDAMYLKVRQNHRIVSLAMVIAIGVDQTGERHLLGFDLGASEDEDFWLAFLRSLVERGMKTVELVISDAHLGLKKAMSQVFSGASWQRCRVHFMRNLLAHIPKRDKSAVADAVRMIFEQPDRYSASVQLRWLVQNLGNHYPEAAKLLSEADEDILMYKTFPKSHWRRIHSTNSLERIHKEIRRRTKVVGVFPDRASVIRLVGSILKEIDDDWRGGWRYFQQESMEILNDWEPTPNDEPMSFLVTSTADLLSEAQTNLHH
jgi:putative transposase